MSPKRRSSPQKVGIETRLDTASVEIHRGWVPHPSRKSGAKIRGPWTYNLSEARSWRIDALARLDQGKLHAGVGPLLGPAADTFLSGAVDGSILNRSRRPYKPSAIRGLRTSLTRLATDLGRGMPLAELDLTTIQRFIDDRSQTAQPQTVCNDVNALRSLFAWSRRRERILQGRDPFEGILLPRGENARDRIAAPAEMALLIAALPADDRAMLAIAAYAGLRRGEVLALDRASLNLENRLIGIRRAWDPGAQQFIAPKTASAFRNVPIVERLQVILEDHLETLDDDPAQLLFPGRRGAGATLRPMSEGAFMRRAFKRWNTINEKTVQAATNEGRDVDQADLLSPIGLHEARHTYASIAIAAGVNAKALSTYMGHSSIQITFDRYGHLMPGNEAEALLLMDRYLQPDGPHSGPTTTGAS